MERVIVNEGTKVNLFQLFEDLQDDTKLNALRIFEALIYTFGVNAQTNIDGTIASTDTALQVVTGGAGYVNVNPGDAITGDLSWIGITNVTPVSTIGLGAGLHTLFLGQAYQYDTPVDVLSGFAIGLAGIAQKNSRAHDTYVFTWDSNVAPSGIVLADVTLDGGGNVTTITDRRDENVLMFKSSVIPTQILLGNQSSGAGAPVPPLNVRVTNISAATVSTASDPALLNQADRQIAHGLPSQEIAVDLGWNWDNVSWYLYGSQIGVQLNPGRQTVVADELKNYHLWHPYGYDYLIVTHTAGGVGGSGPILMTVTPFGDNTTQITSLPPVNGGGVIHSNASQYEVLTVPVAANGIAQILDERYEDFARSSYTGRQAPVIEKLKLYLYVGEKELIQVRSLGPIGQASVYTVLPAGSFNSTVFKSPVNYTSPFVASMPFVDDGNVTVTAVPAKTGFTVTISTPATGGWAPNNVNSYEIVWATDQNSLSFDAASNSVFSQSSNGTVIPVTYAPDTIKQIFVKVRPQIGGMGVSDGIIANGGIPISVGTVTTNLNPSVKVNKAPSLQTFTGTLLGPYTIQSNVQISSVQSSFTQQLIGPTLVTSTYFVLSGLVSPALSQFLQPSANKVLGQVGAQLMLTYSGITTGKYYVVDSSFDPGTGNAGTIPQTAVVLKYSTLSDPALAGQVVTTLPAYTNFMINWDQNARVLYRSGDDPGFDFVITQIVLTYDSLLGYDGLGHYPVLRVYNGSTNGARYGFKATLPQSTSDTGGQVIFNDINVICSIIQGAAATSPASGPGGRNVVIDLYNPDDPFGPSNAVGINWGTAPQISYTYQSFIRLGASV